MSDKEIEIECLRCDPKRDRESRWQSWLVPFSDDMSVLQALQYIRHHLDDSLSFCWTCRMAICGSCGDMLNGLLQLSCHAFVRDYFPGKLRIDPPQHFPAVRDLVVDQSDFLDKLAAVKPHLVRREDKPLAAGAHRQTPQQMAKYYAYSQCINCLLCCATCPQYGLDSGFTGPAALALLHRDNADSRDVGCQARSEVVNAEQGMWGCTLVGYCCEVRPKAVDPAHVIYQNKVNSTLDDSGLLKLMTPKGGRS